MASTPERTDPAKARSDRMSSDYGQRAAYAVNRLVPGPNRDKAVARIFGCSVRTAQYLRVGLHWSIERLNIASEHIRGFDAYLATDLTARLDWIEEQISEIRNNLRQGTSE